MNTDDDVVDPFINVWPKVCSKCGFAHTIESWQRLPCVGYTEATEFGPKLEYRNCACTSTLTVSIGYEPDKVITT